jgi:citrate synthase
MFIMFAIGRLPGWGTVERNERKQEPIGRPRQIYTGSPLRDFQTAEKEINFKM